MIRSNLDALHPHRLQDDERGYGCHDIHRAGREEDRMPAPSEAHQNIAERHEQRGDSFGGEDQTIVRRGIFRPEYVSAKRWKDAVDLSPGKEDEAGEENEGERVGAELRQRENTIPISPVVSASRKQATFRCLAGECRPLAKGIAFNRHPQTSIPDPIHIKSW